MTSKIAPRAPLSAIMLENKPAYRYAVSAFAPVATPTDVVVIQGSATKRVIVKLIKVAGASTALGTHPVTVIRRSTAGTIGSAVLTAITPAKMDSNQPAATGVVSTVGTANYTTVGTAAGLVETGRVQLTTLDAGGAGLPFILDFGPRFSKPLILRGILEFCCINFNGNALEAGGVFDITIETEEDDGV
jgi:hypothetical protein